MRSNELTPADVICLLWKRGWLLAGFTLGGVVATVVASMFMTPIFRAEIVLAPIRDSSSGLSAILGDYGALASMAGINLNLSQGGRDEAVATLRSRAFGERFIVEKQLLPELFPDDWDAERRRWRESDPKKQPQLWDAWRIFNEKVRKISEDRRTGLVTLAIEWRDPEVAAQWANELVDRVNDQIRARDIADAERSIKYLQGQLKSTDLVEARDGIYRLLEAQVKTVTLANTRRDYAFRVIDPAAVPDPTRPMRPRFILMGAAGALLGCILGSSVVIFMAFRSTRRSRRSLKTAA